MNELLFFGDSFLDGNSSEFTVQHRVEQITRLAHRVDLLLPISVEHKDLEQKIVQYVILIREGGSNAIGERMACAGRITEPTRSILREQLASVEANL